MPARQQAVPEVRGGEDDGAAHREQAIDDHAKAAMRDGGANDEQGETRECREYDAGIAVPGVADADCHRTQWYGEKQHLRMQVAVSRRHQEGQCAREKRQREAVQQAQAGEADSGAIEPVRRFRGCMIHEGMPLCCREAPQRCENEMI